MTSDQVAQNKIFNREPFYLSLKVQKLVFTQGSLLKSLVDRWNQQRKARHTVKHLSQSREFQDMFRSNENMAVFLIQLYQVNPHQDQKLCQSITLGEVNDISATTKLYQYPIDLTEMLLKPKHELNSFIYHFSPQVTSELNLVLYMQMTENAEQKTLIGECRLDPNLFIEMCLDEGINCVKDCKKVVKRIDCDKEIDQQVEVMFEMVVARDRLGLEIASKQAKKGINVMDFKQHIRQILKEKEHLEIQQDINENDVSLEKSSDQQLQIQSVKPKRSTVQKYMSYLNRNVECQLQYFNPQKQRIENEVKKLFVQRKQGIQRVKIQSEKLKKNKRQVQRKEINNKSNQYLTQKKPNVFVSKQQEGKAKDILKIVIFVVASAILLYLSMTPSKKSVKENPWHQDDLHLLDSLNSYENQ